MDEQERQPGPRPQQPGQKGKQSMLVKGSILRCRAVSPTASSGQKKSLRPTVPWHRHDSESQGCASPTRGALGPSWKSKRRCRLRWQSCWTIRRRSPRTPGGSWPPRWRSCWSAGQRRWPRWGTGRTKETSPK